MEAVRAAEVLEALGLPVDVAQQGDALDELVGQALARLEIGVERRWPSGRSVSIGDQPSTKPIM